jgi:hypothetical protein
MSKPDGELIRQIEERRSDPEFMGRLHRIMVEQKDVLDRLAGGHGGSPTHMQFIGGTIYCSVKGGRLKLGDHRYGRSFTCPYCHSFVGGRLDAEGPPSLPARDSEAEKP